MNENDFINVWNSQKIDSDNNLNKSHEELIKIVTKNSNDIFSKIKKNVMIESVLSIILAITFPLLFLAYPVFFWTMIAIMIFAMILSIKVYGLYFKDLKKIDQSSIKESLEIKLNILKRYVKQLKLYSLISFFLGLPFGLAFAMKDDPIETLKILLVIAILIPFVALALWLGNKYIYLSYGKHIKGIEELLESLNNVGE